MSATIRLTNFQKGVLMALGELGTTTTLPLIALLESAGYWFVYFRVYRNLQHLEDKGLVKLWSVPGGPERRYMNKLMCELTGIGRQFVDGRY